MKPSHLSPSIVHHKVWTLLPWYVNGTLQGAEFDLVQQHLRVCVTCRRELAEQQRLAEAIGQFSVTDLAPRPSFARLMQRIESEGSQARLPKMGWSRLRSQWARVSQWLSGALSLQRAWIAVPILVLLIALAPTARFWLSSLFKAPQYHTLANPNSVLAGSNNDIRVIFAKTIGPEQIRQLALSLHAEVVAGPRSSGAYTFRIATSDQSNQQMLAALVRLQQHPDVLLAEPADLSTLPKKRPDSGP